MSTSPKQLLRTTALAARRALDERGRRERALRIAHRLTALDLFERARTIALYAAIGAEVDTGEIARAATARGKVLAFPRFSDDERALRFAACTLDALVPAPHGTRQPPASAPAIPYAALDLVLVPGVAFDVQGHRLGRGRGHYDATLAQVPATAARVGLAFEVQLVAEVPQEPHDAPLDAVVTEDRVVFRLPADPRRGKSPAP